MCKSYKEVSRKCYLDVSGVHITLEDIGDPDGRWFALPGVAAAAADNHLSNLAGQTGSPFLTNEAVKRSESVHS